MSNWVESLLRGLEPSAVTEFFLWLIVVLFLFCLAIAWKGKPPPLTSRAPALLASLGILGTFVGIVVGLLDFDPGQLDESIEGLLEGLKTAFISSIAGIFASVVFRGFEVFLPSKTIEEADTEVGPKDIFTVLTQQKELLETTRDAIAGQEESSLAGQLKLLRTDMADRRREDTQVRKRFQTELWEQLHTFSEMLSKSATEQVIQALKEVIVDFNQNLTEQFGDNFKKLDDSVRRLVEWQEGYRRQLEQLHKLYDDSVRQITAIEGSVRIIAQRTQVIPDTLEALTEIVRMAGREIEELERHLAAFAELRDRAVEAVPQTQAHVEAMTQDIAAAVRLAGENFIELQNDVGEQQEKSRQLLEHLGQASQKIQNEVEVLHDHVAEAILRMQSRLESALKETLSAQDQATNTMVKTMLDGTQEAVTRTGEGVSKQIEALDEALSQEVTRVMQQMGNALSQITGKFVADYTKLTRQMKEIVRRGNWQ